MSYSDFLKDPRWQRLRLETFERDNFTCKQCHSSEKELQVHHIEYFEGMKPWEYPLDMLVTLCKDCHQKETDIRPKHEKYLLQSLKSKGFLASDILCLSTLIDSGRAFYIHLKETVRRAQK